MTKNEPLVANSITIPPIGVTDYYKFFGIEEHRPFIEKLLTDYSNFKKPKRTEAVAGNRTTPRNKTGTTTTKRRVSK